MNYENRFYIANDGCCISNSFGYTDVIEGYERNRAPLLKEGMVLAVLEDYPSKKQCRVRIMEVSKTNLMCSEVCELTDCEIEINA